MIYLTIFFGALFVSSGLLFIVAICMAAKNGDKIQDNHD